MSGSDETAEEARRLAGERAFTAKRFLAALDRGGYTNVDLATVPDAERDLALPALRAMARQRSGIIRLNAARALVEFGDRLGGEVLIECLQSEDSALRKGAIDRVSWLQFRDRMRSPNPPFDADALLVALEPSLADPDRWNRKRALSFVSYLETPKAFDRLVAFLGDARPDMRAEAACMLGDAGYDRGALAVIEDLLREPRSPYRYFLVRALEHLCKSTDAGLRSRAAAAAIGFIRNNLDEHRHSALEANSLANDVWHCMDGIAAACSQEQRDILNGALRQVLHEVLASKLVWWVRGMALTRLAQMEGQAGVARLIAALSDPDLRKEALEGLASLAAGFKDPAVLATLSSEIQRGNATHISALIKAFLAVGGNAKGFAQDVVDRLEPEMATTVRWLLNDIGPREVAAKLQPACGDIPANEEVLQDLEAKWQAKPDTTQVIWGLLHEWKRIAVPFYKTVQSPVDHDETVRELAAISGGHFSVDEVVQTTEASGDFRLLLVHQGLGYSIPVQNHGRWCNVRAVIDGLNGILDGLDRPERFIELSSGTGDVAVVTFARADIFMPLARELGNQLGRAN
jgi:HEAT repeat protein